MHAWSIRECPTHLKHELARWGGGVDALLIELEIDVACSQALDCLK
jgi:hypothetical protein